MDFRVDFTSENILPDGSNFGHVGEHNRATLVITPPAEMTDNPEILYICLACEVSKNVEFIKAVVRSEMHEKAATIRIPLWGQATIGESAKLQLEGYDGSDNLLVKTDLVEYSLSPSASGVRAATDMNGGSLAATVAKNSAQIEKLALNGGGKVKKIFIPYDASLTTGCYAYNFNNDDTLAFYLIADYAVKNNLIDIFPVNMSIKYKGEEKFVAQLLFDRNIARNYTNGFYLQTPKAIEEGFEDLIFAIIGQTNGNTDSLYNAVITENGEIEGVYLYYFDKIEEVE